MFIICSLVYIGKLVIALWPQTPIAITRIWCLYELWCAIDNKIPITSSYINHDKISLLVLALRTKKGNCLYDVHVEKATARRLEDIATILDIIQTTTGVEEMNKIINEGFNESVNKHLDYSRNKFNMFFLGFVCTLAAIIIAAATNLWIILLVLLYPVLLVSMLFYNTYCIMTDFKLDNDI